MQRMRGFTLLELMIVVAVLAIIVAFAYPSYRDHVVKTKRKVAAACLMEYAQWMERYYTTNMKYQGATLPSTTCATDLSGDYSFAFATGEPTASTYEIEATPQGAQASSDGACGTLSIDQAGTRTVSGSGSVASCWVN